MLKKGQEWIDQPATRGMFALKLFEGWVVKEPRSEICSWRSRQIKMGRFCPFQIKILITIVTVLSSSLPQYLLDWLWWVGRADKPGVVLPVSSFTIHSLFLTLLTFSPSTTWLLYFHPAPLGFFIFTHLANSKGKMGARVENLRKPSYCE